jgi:hypothetical protein
VQQLPSPLVLVVVVVPLALVLVALDLLLVLLYLPLAVAVVVQVLPPLVAVDQLVVRVVVLEVLIHPLAEGQAIVAHITLRRDLQAEPQQTMAQVVVGQEQ